MMRTLAAMVLLLCLLFGTASGTEYFVDFDDGGRQWAPPAHGRRVFLWETG